MAAVMQEDEVVAVDQVVELQEPWDQEEDRLPPDLTHPRRIWEEYTSLSPNPAKTLHLGGSNSQLVHHQGSMRFECLVEEVHWAKGRFQGNTANQTGQCH